MNSFALFCHPRNYYTTRFTQSHMSDSDEFLDAESENNFNNFEKPLNLLNFDDTHSIHSIESDFSIEGPNSITNEEVEEFYDVIEDPKVAEQQGKTKQIPFKLLNNKRFKQRLSILEFLHEEPEELENENRGNELEEEKNLNNRETIYEFLNDDDEKEEDFAKNNQESESSLSRLQSELAEPSDQEKIRKSILNLPKGPLSRLPPPPSFPRKSDSLLRRAANPLAAFFTDLPHGDFSDSDSMISELTEAMTNRTDFSDIRLSRNPSVFNPAGTAADAGDYLKLAKRCKPVPVKTKSKQKSEFSSLFLIQELNRRSNGSSDNSLTRSNSYKSNDTADGGKDPSKAIFVLKFSSDGQFLAAAGAEGIIKIWSIHAVDTEAQPLRLATIFDSNPIQILKGHTAEILDCAWSTNNFLLTASMDKTVRLWHHTRPDALGIFQHLDYVTSVAFNPKDPRVFVSGSLDCKLRLWSIQDRTILHWNELPPGNFITAVAFTRSGSTVVAGTSGGTALIFDTEGLRYNTQILVRSSRSKTVGKKITSIESVPGQYDNDERVKMSLIF
jgi:WD40 repeat protein